MVPKGWEIKRIEQIADVKGGKRIPKGYSLQQEDNGFPYIRVRDMSENGVDTSSILYVPTEIVESISKYTISASDVFITVAGALLGLVGKIPSTLENANLTENADKLTNLKINQDYLIAVLRSPIGKRLIEAEKTTNAQPKLALTRIRNFEIPVPPLLEQQKIAKILSTWDKAISTTERLIDNSTQQKKALMQQLLTGKKRLLDESGKRFDGEWEEIELGEISHITTGSSNREDSSLTGEYAFFDRSIDVRTSGIFLFDAEAIIVGGEGQDFVPKYFEGKFDLHQRTYAIMDFKNAYGKFLFYYIGYYRHYFLSQAVGSTVKSLRLPMFQKMPIKLPSVKEQQKIATVLTNADKEIELLEQQLADLQQEKKALMQVLLTGKKRVVVGCDTDDNEG